MSPNTALEKALSQALADLVVADRENELLRKELAKAVAEVEGETRRSAHWESQYNKADERARELAGECFNWVTSLSKKDKIILGLECTIDNYEARLKSVEADAIFAKTQYEYWMGEVLLSRQNHSYSANWKDAATEWKSKAIEATRLVNEYKDMIAKLMKQQEIARTTPAMTEKDISELQDAIKDGLTMVLNMDAETLDDTADLLEDVGVDSKNVRSYIAGVLHAIEVVSVVLGYREGAND